MFIATIYVVEQKKNSLWINITTINVGINNEQVTKSIEINITNNMKINKRKQQYCY